jgi:hypothetical protein
MRKVKFNIYVERPEGVSCDSPDWGWAETIGFFHGWGFQPVFSHGGGISYKSIALCEDQNGKVHELTPDQIQFTPSQAEIEKRQQTLMNKRLGRNLPKTG